MRLGRMPSMDEIKGGKVSFPFCKIAGPELTPAGHPHRRHRFSLIPLAFQPSFGSVLLALFDVKLRKNVKLAVMISCNDVWSSFIV
jgi:hypothetical protein